MSKMFEKVSPSHPDKIADRIGGAIVDLAKGEVIAGEVMIGHGNCYIIIETNAVLDREKIEKAVERIAGDVQLDLKIYQQDKHLSKNQEEEVKCGDNGIFKGVPLTDTEKKLTKIAKDIYKKHPTDGKYILDNNKLTICQSHTKDSDFKDYKNAIINPLGGWSGGPDVDTGCCNRKLGSDMSQSVTGGGLHFKDLSKADVSVNIYAFLKAQETGKVVELSCSIGDTHVDGKPYSEIVDIARKYINKLGGFEKFAEWGLVR